MALTQAQHDALKVELLTDPTAQGYAAAILATPTPAEAAANGQNYGHIAAYNLYASARMAVVPGALVEPSYADVEAILKELAL